MIGLAITILFFCAILILIFWAFSRVSLPEPVKTVIIIVIIIAMLLWLAGSNGVVGPWR